MSLSAPALSRRTLLAAASAMAAAHSTRALAHGEAGLLAADAMQADIGLLADAYGRLHPGLLRYNSADGIAARWSALRSHCARPLSLPAFYLALSRTLATVRCGHSYANFFNQRREVSAALFEAPDRLPLHFLWLDEGMIVTADPAGTGIVPGSRILSIDGRPAEAVLAALMPYARADGRNDGKRRRLLSMQGEDRIEFFDVFFSLLFGRPRYRLEVEAPDGRRRVATVAAMARRPAPPTVAEDQPIWTMERRGAAALLTMPGWALYDSAWDWRGWLDEQVDRLIADRVPRLVVDLRANEGGNDCGNALAARLLTHEVPFDEARRRVRYRTVPDALRPALDTWDRSFDRLGERATKVDDRFFELDDPADRMDPIRPDGRRYDGDLRVLIGPQNSSATFQFAGLVRRARLGTLVGEETGGNRRGINGGCFYFLRLPATALEVDLPLIGQFPRTPQPDAGILPDLRVPILRADVAAGRDRQLERALA